MAPESDRLGLLPSGPDPVHRPPPHRTQSSTLTGPTVPLTADPQPGIQPRCSGLRVQGTASSPSSTTEQYSNRKQDFCQRIPGLTGGPTPPTPEKATGRPGHGATCVLDMAEREGFEPSIPCRIHDFQSCALDRTMRPLRATICSVYRPANYYQQWAARLPGDSI